MNQRQQLEQKLIEKAMKDDAFRQQLIENPDAAIEDETGMKMPEAMKIIVLEETPQTVYLVLPQAGNNSSKTRVLPLKMKQE